MKTFFRIMKYMISNQQYFQMLHKQSQTIHYCDRIVCLEHMKKRCVSEEIKNGIRDACSTADIINCQLVCFIWFYRFLSVLSVFICFYLFYLFYLLYMFFSSVLSVSISFICFISFISFLTALADLYLPMVTESVSH